MPTQQSAKQASLSEEMQMILELASDRPGGISAREARQGKYKLSKLASADIKELFEQLETAGYGAIETVGQTFRFKVKNGIAVTPSEPVAMPDRQPQFWDTIARSAQVLLYAPPNHPLVAPLVRQMVLRFQWNTPDLPIQVISTPIPLPNDTPEVAWQKLRQTRDYLLGLKKLINHRLTTIQNNRLLNRPTRWEKSFVFVLPGIDELVLNCDYVPELLRWGLANSRAFGIRIIFMGSSPYLSDYGLRPWNAAASTQVWVGVNALAGLSQLPWTVPTAIEGLAKEIEGQLDLHISNSDSEDECTVTDAFILCKSGGKLPFTTTIEERSNENNR